MGLSLPTLVVEEKNWVDRDFDREKIVSASKELQGDKAPGPNSFSMAFFQRC